jgi:hypothetical protein
VVSSVHSTSRRKHCKLQRYLSGFLQRYLAAVDTKHSFYVVQFGHTGRVYAGQEGVYSGFKYWRAWTHSVAEMRTNTVAIHRQTSQGAAYGVGIQCLKAYDPPRRSAHLGCQVAVPGEHVRNDRHNAIIRHHGTRRGNLRGLKAYPCQNGKNMLKVTILMQNCSRQKAMLS